MYDVHAHLTPKWIPNYLEVAENSINKGLKGIINSAAEQSEYKFAISLSQQYPQTKPALGISPQLIEQHNLEIMMNFIQDEANKGNLAAIGEIGLDYHWVKTPNLRKKQATIFKNAIELANKHDLPIIIHSRNSDEEVFDILEKCAKTSVILHSFSGNTSLATQAVEKGYFLSFSTAICYSKPKQRVVKLVPVENLLVETDSPFLHPKPGQGLKNKPLNVNLAAKKIAELRNMSLAEIEKMIDANVEKLFPFS